MTQPGGAPDPLGDAAGGAADVAGGAVDAIGTGLATAASAAGDVLSGIFGCLPWESTCDPSTVSAFVDVVGVVG